MLAAVYVACLAMVGLSALRYRQWLLGTAVLVATGQAVITSLGDPHDAVWLTRVWLPGEAVSLVPMLALVVVCIGRETEPLVPFRRLTLRVSAGAIGVAFAGLVWITARYETLFWVFATHRAKFWMAAAVALAIVVLFIPHSATRVTWFVLLLSAAHALTALLSGSSQPVFRIIAILICLGWLTTLLVAHGSPASSGELRHWRHRRLS